MVKKMELQSFNFSQLNEEEFKEQYQVTITNKFAAQEHVENNGHINGAWDSIIQNIRISVKESIGCE
jgi:GTPase SAR1 family protein